MNRLQLRDDIVINFNDEELRQLCVQLELAYASLPGSTLRDKTSVLIGKLERTNRLQALVDAIVAKRPHLAQRYDQQQIEPPAAPTEEERLNWLDNIERPNEEPPTMRWDTTARYTKKKKDE